MGRKENITYGAVGFGIGTLLGVLIDRVVAAPASPEGHSATVNRIKVTTFSFEEPTFNLVPQLVWVGYEVPYAGETVTEPKLPESLWIFRHRQPYPRFYDVGMVLKIWGPFNKGAYNLEFARLNAGEMRIYIDGNLIFELPDVTAKLQQEYPPFGVGPRWMFPGYIYTPIGPEPVVPGAESIVNQKIINFYKQLLDTGGI